MASALGGALAWRTLATHSSLCLPDAKAEKVGFLMTLALRCKCQGECVGVDDYLLIKQGHVGSFRGLSGARGQLPRAKL